MQRVEKLCHSKRMHVRCSSSSAHIDAYSYVNISQVALTVWRDEANGLINGRAPNQIVDLTSDADSDNEDGGAHRRSSSRHADAGDAPEEGEDHESSLPPTRPPSSPSNTDDIPDDFDIDALLREEEAQAHAPPSAPSASKGTDTNANADDELWDEFMQDLPTEPYVPTVPPIPPQSSSPSHADADDDEEMWDIVREMEQSNSANANEKNMAVPSSNETSAPQPDPHVSQEPEPQEPIRATNDEGWDEMYL